MSLSAVSAWQRLVAVAPKCYSAQLAGMMELLILLSLLIFEASVAVGQSGVVELTSPQLRTRQSSAGSSEQVSFLAIDGDVLSYSVTANEVNPWWWVLIADSGSLFTIQSVFVAQQSGVDQYAAGSMYMYVLVGNDSSVRPSVKGDQWVTCGFQNQSEAAHLFCCSRPVVGRAVAIYAQSVNGPKPLRLSEVKVFGFPSRCATGTYGRRCELTCGACGVAIHCECNGDGCISMCPTCQRGGDPLSTCKTPAASPTVGHFMMVKNSPSDPITDKVSRQQCDAYQLAEDEVITVVYALVYLPLGFYGAHLMVGNDSGSIAFPGSSHWTACNSFGSLSPGRTVLSCEKIAAGRHVVAFLMKNPDVGMDHETVTADALYGFLDRSFTPPEEKIIPLDLSFLGYYWMDGRRYALNMHLALPAFFAIVMMTVTFAIACVRRKKVVSDNVYRTELENPLLETEGGSEKGKL